MKVLVTGADGQLGQALKSVFKLTDIETIFLTKSDLDIASEEAVLSKFKYICPDIAINAAAYTSVDLAEEFSDEAFRINELGAINLSKGCNIIHAPLIHFSTDYVFNGKKRMPYLLSDDPDPINIYGKSKLCGEQKIQKQCSKYLIIRSSWIYSEFGNNFLKTMMSLAKKNTKISVVNDQFGSPTYAVDLAESLVKILPIIKNNNFKSGLYHYAGEDTLSWKDFADQIFYHAFKIGLIDQIPEIKGVLSANYPMQANRPYYSSLDSSCFLKTFNVNPIQTSLSILRSLENL